MTIEEVVVVLVAEQMGEPDPSKITPNISFGDDLGADSLDQVELEMAFEEAFGITIPDGDSDGIKTVQQAIDYIKKMGGKV